jgi:predicted transcriptional regulator
MDECRLRVKEIMSSPTVLAGENTTIEEAVKLMKMYGISSIILVRDRIPVAMFTDKELIYTIATLECQALRENAYYHSNKMFPIVKEDACIEDAVREMNQYNMRHAVVVNEYGYVVGVISMRDIAKATHTTTE